MNKAYAADVTDAVDAEQELDSRFNINGRRIMETALDIRDYDFQSRLAGCCIVRGPETSRPISTVQSEGRSAIRPGRGLFGPLRGGSMTPRPVANPIYGGMYRERFAQTQRH